MMFVLLDDDGEYGYYRFAGIFSSREKIIEAIQLAHAWETIPIVIDGVANYGETPEHLRLQGVSEEEIQRLCVHTFVYYLTPPLPWPRPLYRVEEVKEDVLV